MPSDVCFDMTYHSILIECYVCCDNRKVLILDRFWNTEQWEFLRVPKTCVFPKHLFWEELVSYVFPNKFSYFEDMSNSYVWKITQAMKSPFCLYTRILFCLSIVLWLWDFGHRYASLVRVACSRIWFPCHVPGQDV